MAKQDATVSLGESVPLASEGTPQPTLSLLLRSDQPLGPSRRLSLADADSVVIGRGESLGTEWRQDAGGRCLFVSIPDRHMSTSHVRLLRLPAQQWIIEDAGSKNGTSLNGAPCTRAPLRDGDLFELGGSFLLHQLVELAQPAGTDPVAAAPLPVLATLSAPLAASYAALARLAPSPLSVLLLGETGVGKEVVARAVHELSGRRGEFVAVNCGAIPATLIESTLFGHRRGAFSGAVENRPGLLRSADGGTLFLDEIGELPLAAQVTLLRVLQEREVVPVGETRPQPVDTRVVAATNRDLRAGIEAGSFREDLFARLTGMIVRIPPVRSRREDLGLLIGALLRRVAPDPAAVRFTPRAARALLRYPWPRNVRELESCLMAAVLLANGSEEVDLAHLSEEVRAAARSGAPLAPGSDSDSDEHAREHEPGGTPAREPGAAELIALLETHGGNISAIARVLDTSRTHVYRLLKRHHVAMPARSSKPGS